MRLVGDGGRCAGRLEILNKGQWITLCADHWHMKDAAVLCRELGCGEAVDVVGSSHFGPGSGKLWPYGRACDGSETAVKKCGSINLKSVSLNCDRKDVGVICSGKPPVFIHIYS